MDYSGLAVSALNGTNFSTDTPASNAMFYRLQYASGVQMIPVVSWQTNTDGLTLQMNPGTLKLQVFSPRVDSRGLRLSNSVPTNSLAVIASSTNSGWNASASENEISLATAALQVRVNRATGAVGFYDTNGAAILTEPLDRRKIAVRRQRRRHQHAAKPATICDFSR